MGLAAAFRILLVSMTSSSLMEICRQPAKSGTGMASMMPAARMSVVYSFATEKAAYFVAQVSADTR